MRFENPRTGRVVHGRLPSYPRDEGSPPVPADTSRVSELESALQSLVDLQNGPPLAKYAREWRAAMSVARKLLSKK